VVREHAGAGNAVPSPPMPSAGILRSSVQQQLEVVRIRPQREAATRPRERPSGPPPIRFCDRRCGLPPQPLLLPMTCLCADISSTVAEEYFGATAPSRPREHLGSALRRVGKTASYNAARVVFSASEHGPAPSPREATLAPSPGFDRGIFVKTATKGRGQETRCTCPKSCLAAASYSVFIKFAAAANEFILPPLTTASVCVCVCPSTSSICLPPTPNHLLPSS